jgi:glycerol-3-phosphate dehydrogenase
MKNKQKTNEGLFGSAKKFTDSFFDGLKNNAVDSVIKQAEQSGVPFPITKKLQQLRKEKEELDALIKKYSK